MKISLCPRLHVAFSVCLSVSSSSFKDISVIGFRAHPTSRATSSQRALANYICKDCVSKQGPILQFWMAMNFGRTLFKTLLQVEGPKVTLRRAQRLPSPLEAKFRPPQPGEDTVHLHCSPSYHPFLVLEYICLVLGSSDACWVSLSSLCLDPSNHQFATLSHLISLAMVFWYTCCVSETKLQPVLSSQLCHVFSPQSLEFILCRTRPLLSSGPMTASVPCASRWTVNHGREETLLFPFRSPTSSKIRGF